MNLIVLFGLACTLAHPGREVDLFPVVANGIATRQASSVYNPSCDTSRLALYFNQNREGCQGWIPARTDANQWVQLSTQKVHTWFKLITQGRGDANQWVTSFTIDYTENGVDWLPYDNSRVLHSNYDKNSLVTHPLRPPIIARSIKIKPMTFHSRPALRLEAYVSELPDNYTLVPSPEPIPAIKSGLSVSTSSVWSPGEDRSRIQLHFNQQRESAASWCAAANDIQQWAQVSSIEPKQWVKVSTQGRGDHDNWVKSYYLTYTENGRDWHQVDGGTVFGGNSDQNGVVTHEFEEPFMARAVRVHPMTWHGLICLRMELYFFDL